MSNAINNEHYSYFKEITKLIKDKKPNKNQLSKLKTEVCRKFSLKKIPTDIEILLNANKGDIEKIKKYLVTKPTRTISGVAVIAVMTKPIKCPHGKCSYCPGGPSSIFGSVPQSYTGKEPAARRAIRNNFDPYLQVMNRLEQYIVAGHVPDKIELIVMGGTFPSFPKKYRQYFIKYAFKAMNDFSFLFFNRNNEINILKFKQFFELPGNIEDKKRQKSLHKKLLLIKNIQLKKSLISEIKKTNLEEEQLKNEGSNIKCIGLTIETRSDYGKLKHGNEMLKLGATRIELGVQTIYDDILKKVQRGHSVKDSIESTRILKDLGFKVNYHIMPGLPGSNAKKDLKSLKEIFLNENFKPDMLKIYPCMVLKGTKLYNLWKRKKYTPLTTEQAADLIVEFKKFVPRYVRIMRVQRDIPTFATEAGVDKTNLRQYIKKLMRQKNIKCRCIRCREIGNREIKKITIKKIKYRASEGMEYFISAESENNIIGFCRLRLPSEELRKEITKSSALVRELHVFGPAVSLGKKGNVQHKGIGKKLLKEAEKISSKKKKNKVIVISGIGARNYYRRLGYEKEGAYMVKYLNKNDIE